METTHRRLASTLLLPILAACGGSDGGGDWAGTVRDSAGVAIVENPIDGIWSPEDGWTVEEVFRVGGMDAGADAEFGSVIGVDVDAQGRVFVADQQGRQVRVFDADGAFVRTVGAPGEGPGEFGPAVMGVFVTGDNVLVPDMGNQRISVFTLDGDPLPPRRLALQDGIPIRWDETADGDLVAQRRGLDAEGMAALEDGDPIATVPPEGEESRVLATVPKGQSFSVSGGAPSFRIFEPEPIWDLAGADRVAFGMNDAYRIELWQDGALQRVVTRPVQPVEVTEGEERRIRDMTREMMVATGAPPQAVEQILGQMEFADSYPVFAQVLLSEEGTLWVQRIRTSRDVPEGVEWSAQDLGSNEWDVFDADGRYLGVLSFPLRFQPLREVDGVVWGVERDDFDVQSVVGYRVVTGA
ncbi:MAG TPA: 6-bladed beta-propeller [Longimicrobiales bacterium]|nr:6-bladed beta-propeller [Longimicrobiales bacterium]